MITESSPQDTAYENRDAAASSRLTPRCRLLGGLIEIGFGQFYLARIAQPREVTGAILV